MHENGPAMSTPFLLPLHFGHLPLWQQLLVVLIAFGPFLILGAVVLVLRRQDLAAEQEGHTDEDGSGR
jgi:hypothetical protein